VVASGVTATLIDEFCVTDGLQAAVLSRAVVIKRLPRLPVELDGPKSMKSKVLCLDGSLLQRFQLLGGHFHQCWQEVPLSLPKARFEHMQAANQGLGRRRDQTAQSVG
jgi:hypothetical protein